MELLKIHPNGQWSLEKAKPLSPEELKAFKDRRDAYLREKHSLPSKESDPARANKPAPDEPKTSRPDYSSNANKKYKEGYHSSTREVAPGKFVYAGTAKKPAPDVSPPISKRPEPKGFGFERSPVRMSPKVGKR